MKKLLRCTAMLLLAIATVVALGVLVPRPLFPQTGDGSPDTHRILVLSNPIHTDIAIPIDASVLARFPFLMEAGIPATHPNARWLIFGWGGRAFYMETPTWSELKLVPLMKALTVDSSVMHVDVVGDIIEPNPVVAGYNLSDAEFAALIDFIDGSFARSDGQPIPIAGVAYGEYDRFFEANGYFNALGGCNTWTAKALRSAGLRTGWWDPLPVALKLSMALYN